jgi:phospholipid/cholesterol/gamma-HCH transport system ATP-binding protein
MGWGEQLLLEDASFEVARRDIFVILGGSGSGKSTLLRHLIGLEPPLAGTIEIDGVALDPSARRPPPFGVMFQSGALLGSLTAGENIALGLEEWTELPGDAIHAIVLAKLRLVGLEHAVEKMPAELSGGMKKRVAIARAMVLEPDLLFLDEPSAGLDPISASELDQLILTLNRDLGLTVVVVTHDLESIYGIGKHCIMLDSESKSIIARGDPRSLRDETSDPRVHAFFNRMSKEAA